MIATADTGTPTVRAWRCFHCGRILAKLSLGPGSEVQIKCSCNAMNVLQVQNAVQSEEEIAPALRQQPGA